jgi:glycosyltransferase involved in cell wall biosynthesis
LDVKNFIFVLGTDPEKKSGGIAFAIPGHLAAYEAIGFETLYITSHSSVGWHGKFIPWLKAIHSLLEQLINARREHYKPIVICHVGGGALSMLRKFTLGGLAKLLGGHVVMHLHGLEVNSYLGGGLKQRFFTMMLCPVDAIAVLTPWWKSRLSEAGIGKPVYVVPNPMPLEWQKKAEGPLIEKELNETINILAVSRLEQGKGVDDLIEAMALLPDNYHLSIAGSGRQQDELVDRVRSLKLEGRVQFRGWVSGIEKQKLFDQADIFCLPSRYDSFGMGYLEAMANGLPVVAYNWGPIADVVADNQCGYLSEEYTPTALAESIKRLETYSAREKMGREAKKWVLEQFSVSRIAKDIKKILE